MTIELYKDTETTLIASIKRYFVENFDDEIGDLKASLPAAPPVSLAPSAAPDASCPPCL